MINIKIFFVEGNTESGVFKDRSEAFQWVLDTLEDNLDTDQHAKQQELEFLTTTTAEVEQDVLVIVGYETYSVSYLDTEQRMVSNDFSFYQDLAKLTAVYPEENALAYLTTGLASECGEFCSLIARQFRADNKHVDLEGISKELGDILWMVSQLASHFNLSLGKIAQENILKLQDRQQRNVLKGTGGSR